MMEFGKFTNRNKGSRLFFFMIEKDKIVVESYTTDSIHYKPIFNLIKNRFVKGKDIAAMTHKGNILILDVDELEAELLSLIESI